MFTLICLTYRERIAFEKKPKNEYLTVTLNRFSKFGFSTYKKPIPNKC